jgi:hypothetical protein
MSIVEKWSKEKRREVKRQIDEQADIAAKALGAQNVVMIVFFRDDDYMHMMEGGRSPVPVDQLFKMLASANEMLEDSGGDDISLS